MCHLSRMQVVLALAIAASANAQTLTTTGLVTSLSPSFAGQSVTFTATVTESQGIVPDGETVTFYDSVTQIGTGSTSGGVATFSTFTLTAKTHTIMATYAGDVNFTSSSGTVKQVVRRYTSGTAISADLNPSTFGHAAQFTATVSSSGTLPVTGTVTFKEGSTVLGKAKVTGGLTVLRYSKLSPGTHLITGQYNGDNYTAASVSAPVTQVVNSASTGVMLGSKPNQSKQGQTVTLTATVTSPNLPPTGTVTFMDGTTVLATATVASGKASFTSSSLSAGLHQITAVYSDAFTGSQSSSAPLVQVVVGPGIAATPGYYSMLTISGVYQTCPPPWTWQAQWPPAGKAITFYNTTFVDAPSGIGSSAIGEYISGIGGPIWPNTTPTLYTCSASVNLLTAGIEYGHAHAFLSVEAGDANPAAIFHNAAGYTAASWYDQLYVFGVPGGTTVQLQVTSNLYAAISCDPAIPGSGVSYQSILTGFPSVTLSSNCPSPAPFSQTNSQVINVQAGSPISLNEVLTLNPQAVQVVSTMDADAYMTIQPLTAGATVVSMSGLDYSH